MSLLCLAALMITVCRGESITGKVWEGIRTVHVVQTCHLDVGFADTAAGIINRYHGFLLNAASISQDFRTNPGKEVQSSTHMILTLMYS